VWAPPATVDSHWPDWVRQTVRAVFLPPGGTAIDITSDITPDISSDITARASAVVHDAAPSSGHRSQPFWSSLIAADHVSAVDPASPDVTDHRSAQNGHGNAELGHEVASADLVIADLTGRLSPLHGLVGDGGAAINALGRGGIDDRLGMIAARALRPGGILAVLTQSGAAEDRGAGPRQVQGIDGATAAAIDDPTGFVVASAQNADLLYLQHIVIPTAPLTRLITVSDAREGSGLDAGVGHIDLLIFLKPRPRSRPTTDGSTHATPSTVAATRPADLR
jgi:hypothetical protein